MTIKLQLTAKLDQRLVMNQQLRQAITLLQYTTFELKEIVQQAIEANPLLELNDNYPATNKEPAYVKTAQYHSPRHSSKKHIDHDEQENLIETYTRPKT